VASTTVVVLDDPAPEAAALPGLPGCRGRVLVSTGLLAALDHDERAAVLAHEHAHLAHSHRIFATIAGLAAAVNPILGPVRRDLGFVLERWADEEAAARTAPSVAARAIAKAALVKLALGRPGSLAGGAVLYVAAVGVPERVAALLGEDGSDGAGPVLWAIAVLVVVAAAATAWATHDTERLFEALRSR
jgi:beta-lactamase regulating signal transducer with metallopeptidase domain